MNTFVYLTIGTKMLFSPEDINWKGMKQVSTVLTTFRYGEWPWPVLKACSCFRPEKDEPFLAGESDLFSGVEQEARWAHTSVARAARVATGMTCKRKKNKHVAFSLLRCFYIRSSSFLLKKLSCSIIFNLSQIEPTVSENTRLILKLEASFEN